jgi:hypothetical protein
LDLIATASLSILVGAAKGRHHAFAVFLSSGRKNNVDWIMDMTSKIEGVRPDTVLQ